MSKQVIQITADDTLFHVCLGDNDHMFIFAKNKASVRRKINNGGEFTSDMINYIVKLDVIDNAIRANERANMVSVLQREYPAITCWPCWQNVVNGVYR